MGTKRRLFLTLILLAGFISPSYADDTSTGQDNSKIDDSKNGIDGFNYQSLPTAFNSNAGGGSSGGLGGVTSALGSLTNSGGPNPNLAFFNQAYAKRTSGQNSGSIYGINAGIKFATQSGFGSLLSKINGASFPILNKGEGTSNGFGQVAGSLMGGQQKWEDHYTDVVTQAGKNVSSFFGNGSPLTEISKANQKDAAIYTTAANSNQAKPSKYYSTTFKSNKAALEAGMCHMVAADDGDSNAYDVTMKSDGTYEVSGGPSSDSDSGSNSNNSSKDQTDSCVNCNNNRDTTAKKLGNSMKAIPTSLNNLNLWYPLVDQMWAPYASPSYNYASYSNDTDNKNSGTGVDDYSYTYVCGKKTYKYALGSVPGKEAWYNGFDYYKHPIQDNDKKGNILASSIMNSLKVNTFGKGGNSTDSSDSGSSSTSSSDSSSGSSSGSSSDGKDTSGNTGSSTDSSGKSSLNMDFRKIKSQANLSSMLEKAKSSLKGNIMDTNRHTIFNAAYKPCWTVIYDICEANTYTAATGKCDVIATQTCEVQLCRNIILPPVKSVNHLQMTYNLAPKGLNGTTKGKYISKSDDDLPFGTDQEMAGIKGGKTNYKKSSDSSSSSSDSSSGSSGGSGFGGIFGGSSSGGGGGNSGSGSSSGSSALGGSTGNQPNYDDEPMNIYYAWKVLNSKYTGYEMPPIAFPGTGKPASQGVINKLNGARQPSDLEKLRPWQATVVSNDRLSPKLDNENVKGVHNYGAQHGFKNEFIMHIANCRSKEPHLNCDCSGKALENGTALGYLRSKTGGIIPNGSSQQTTEKTINIPGHSNDYARDAVGTVGRSSSPVSIVPRQILTKLGDYAIPARVESIAADKKIFGEVTGLNNAGPGDWIILDQQDSSSDKKDGSDGSSSGSGDSSGSSTTTVSNDSGSGTSGSDSSTDSSKSNSNKQKRLVQALVERKIGKCFEISAKGGGLGRSGEPVDSWGIPVGDYDVPAYRTICPASGPFASAASSVGGLASGAAGSLGGSSGSGALSGVVSSASSAASSALSSFFGGVKISGFPSLGGGYPSCADSSVSPCDEPDWDKFIVYHAKQDHRAFSADGSCSGEGCS